MHSPPVLFRMRKAILALRKNDPVIGNLIDRVGPYRIRYIEPDFEALAKAIVYQQLSGKVASAIFGRLTRAASNGKLTAEDLLRLTAPKMRSLCLSRQKITYIRDLAKLVRSGKLNLKELKEVSDEEVMRRLTAVKGIGSWTAHMFLIFALRRPDVVPSGDLGIRAAVWKAYGLPGLPPPGEVEALARNWSPYSTVACWYLWRSQEPDANL